MPGDGSNDPPGTTVPDDQSYGPGSRRVVVVAGGDPLQLPLPRALPAADEVIAVDGGLAASRLLGLHVDLVVGDLDSAEPQHLADATAAGAMVDRYPADKDDTDLALALNAIADTGPAVVTVVGGHGGRLDHLLAGLQLLAAPTYHELEIVALMGPAIVTVIRRRAALTGAPGELLSLVPMHGEAIGVQTTGLRFPLHGEVLTPGTSRGVSNVFTQSTATVQLTSGILLAIQPSPDAPHSPESGVTTSIPCAPNRQEPTR